MISTTVLLLIGVFGLIIWCSPKALAYAGEVLRARRLALLAYREVWERERPRATRVSFQMEER